MKEKSHFQARALCWLNIPRKKIYEAKRQRDINKEEEYTLLSINKFISKIYLIMCKHLIMYNEFDEIKKNLKFKSIEIFDTFKRI